MAGPATRARIQSTNLAALAAKFHKICKIFNFANPFYYPHSGHNEAAGGIVASTGFYLDDGTTEYFIDDDGVGNLRIYSLSGLTRIYLNSLAGTVDYTNGTINTRIKKSKNITEQRSDLFPNHFIR